MLLKKETFKNEYGQDMERLYYGENDIITSIVEQPIQTNETKVDIYKSLTEEQNAIFEIQANIEYLICMMEI